MAVLSKEALAENGDTLALASFLEHNPGGAIAMLDTWRAPELGAQWATNPGLPRLFAKALIGEGRFVLAFEVAREGLTNHPDDVELRYYCALALARARNPSKAWSYMRPLSERDDLDPVVAVDVAALMGRIRKDLCERARDARGRRFQARMSAAAYERALAASGQSYPAINAASMWLIAGDRVRARQFAQKAAALATAELLNAKDDYWLHATLGEARLVLCHDDALAPYETAIALAGRRYGDVASMRRNVQMLADSVDVPPALLEKLAVQVAVFSGHMLDHPNREKMGHAPRFPAEPNLERRLAGEIASAVVKNDVRVAYSSVACGADILFCEAALARGVELHVVLPFALDDFYTTSVDFGRREMASWRTRADAVLARVTEIHYSTRERYANADSLFDHCDSFMRGLAVHRARSLATEPVAIVAHDPSSKLRTGTSQFARTWAAAGRKLDTIDIRSLRDRDEARPRARRARGTTKAHVEQEPRRVHSMLFADVKNFSRLADNETPAFLGMFHAEVAEVLREHESTDFQNTWGDGLFIVCADVVQCAELALGLLKRFDKVKWTKLGLPADTAIRIGLHVGPVYRVRDPVIRRKGFVGTHVTRAARIEPVTAPGCAYASEQFAALLADAPAHQLVCDYVGVYQLAKDFERCALYNLRW